LAYDEIGERASLPERTPPRTVEVPPTPEVPTAGGGPLQLVRYRALFSGTAVERVHELQFQRPAPEIELAPPDAEVRGIVTGDQVRVSSNGTSVELRARINRALQNGVVRAVEEHVRELKGGVEVTRFPGE
jgi:anaerobic selenocysteine-containing dehydrogenase